MRLVFAIVGFSAFVLAYGFVLTHFIPKRLYSFLNIFMSLGSILFGLFFGATLDDMHLAQDAWQRGILWGLAITVPIVFAVLFILLIPRFRHIFIDHPSKLNKKRSILYELGFRVPFGTALSEEVLFRGVLLGLLLTRYDTWVAVICSSLIFGLWHIAPTWKTLRSNIALQELVGEQRRFHGLSILVSVLTTALAGVVFCLLTLKSDSVIAAWIAHSAINGFSVAGGLIAHRLHLKAKQTKQ